MAQNKLMEAAADILAQSKKSAPSDSLKKVDAEVVDLGGPTPENGKPDDASQKIDGAKAVKGNEKNVASIKTKPSDASAKMEEKEETQEVVESEDKSEEVVVEAPQVDEEKLAEEIKEDINKLFADDETISEEFKSKVTTIFEARVSDRVSTIKEDLESKYADMLEEAINGVRDDLTTKVDDYLNYVVEEWMKDNEIAVESGLRNELTEEFISGLKNLFKEHYIDVPAEKVDLVEELASKVEELEGKLNEEVERGIESKKTLNESIKKDVVRVVCEGLTETQVEKIKSLAESVEFSTEDEYKSKLETIRENYFPSEVKKADEEQLHEQVEDTDADKEKAIADPFVAAVSNAIKKQK
jgi:hypothetical protein